MPELPEVETIRRVIEPQIAGQTILHVAAAQPQVIARPDAAAFCAALAGQRFAGLERRGKFLRFCLQNGSRLVLHLRMTGCLLVQPASAAPPPHTHVVFALANGSELRFADTRRFGRFWLLLPGEEDTFSGIAKLGPEPADPACSAAYLRGRLGGRKQAIKTCLLDQSVVAGIGNIYSDEILFAAGLRPDRPARSLTDAEWARLAAAIPAQLAWFTEKNAIPPQEYARTLGKEYRNTPYLRVYGHAGAPCPVCGQTLCRTVLGGRSSVFCPACQH